MARGSIKKYEGKYGSSWKIIVDIGKDPVTGKRKQKKTTIHGTKKEAEAKLAELLRAVDTGTYVEQSKMTLAQYMNQWLVSVAPNISPTTKRRYEGVIKHHINPELGQLQLSQLRPLHIKNFLGHELTGGRKDSKKSVDRTLSAASVKYEYSVLHKALHDAVKLEIITRNPAEAVKSPSPDEKEKKILAPDQISKLLDYIGETYLYIPTFIAIYTGMRLGEILGLTWKNVDFKKGILHVTQSNCMIHADMPQFKKPKTKKSQRTIVMNPQLVETLKKHRNIQRKWRMKAGPIWNDFGLVCCHQNGYPINPPSLSSHFRTVCRRLGFVDITFHNLRHTHASLLLESGISLKVVSERLGHSKVSTTLDVYNHFLPPEQKEAASKIEELLSSVTKP